MNKRGLTLVETLVSIALMSVLLMSLLGAFYISRLSAAHTRHRITAMNVIREYIEYELQFTDWSGINMATGFGNPNIISGDPIDINLEGISATITPEPYYPNNLYSDGIGDDLFYYPVDGYFYRKVGFVVRWDEILYGTGQSVSCEERAAVYVATTHK